MPRQPSQATRLHQLRVHLERRLLDTIKNGRFSYDGDGRPVLDENGTHMRRPPSAADLSVAVKWLGMTGAARAADTDDRSHALQELMKRARDRALPAQDGTDPNLDPDSAYKFPAAEGTA